MSEWNGMFDIARSEILPNPGGYPPAAGRRIAEGTHDTADR